MHTFSSLLARYLRLAVPLEHVLLVLLSVIGVILFGSFVFQAEDGIRDLVRSRGLGDVYKRQVMGGGRGWCDHSRGASGRAGV